MKAEKGLLQVASMLLITQFLLSKYSRPIFFVFVAVFILKIVQNVKRCVYRSVRKVFLAENVFFFFIDIKGRIFRQKELVNELVIAEKGLLQVAFILLITQFLLS